MDKMPMESASTVSKNIRRIEVMFPNCITEAKDKNGRLKKAINFDKLKKMLSEDMAEEDESYEFTWVGKNAAILEANQPTRKTLRPCMEESVNWNTTENLYIEGENLEVLKLLQENYLGQVKMIYIDPPYNTGNDFIFRDDFRLQAEEYEEETGIYDEEDNRLFKNTDSNGRFHSDWCSMMYPRLLLARTLLSNDGVIFISIDENEAHSLRNMCDEVFGAANFIAQLVWAGGRKNDSKYISVSHEYIICYFKNAQYIGEKQIIWRERKQGLDDIYKEYEALTRKHGKNCEAVEKELKAWYKGLPAGHPAKDHSHYCRVDEKGIFFADNISWPGGGGPKYEILHPLTHKPVKIPSRGWLTNKETMERWIEEGRVEFGKDENSVPTLKSYLKDREMSVPYSVIYKDGRAASKRLAALLGGKVFENPKDEEVIQRLIEFSGTDEGDIVMDFFSGSGTTAHALFLANVHQNKRRRFILVQLPEKIDPKKSPEGRSRKVAENAVELLDSIGAPHNICEIGKERIRRAARSMEEKISAVEKLTASAAPSGSIASDRATPAASASGSQELTTENPDTGNVASRPSVPMNFDMGFRVFKLDESNMNDVYYNPEQYDQQMLLGLVPNIKPDRTDLDLLFGCVVDWGLPLSLPYSSWQMCGCTIHDYNHGDLIACFDENVPEEVVRAMAEKKPLRAVFRDAGFKGSPSRINAGELFKMLAPSARIKVI